jgi:Ca2+-binding RTX toxin-like protein
VPFRRALIAALCVAGALLVVPPAALAGTVHIEGTTMFYIDDPANQGGQSDNNNAEVTVSGGLVRVKDPPAAAAGHMDAGPCDQPDPETVACPTSQIATLSVSLGAGDDRIQVLSAIPVSIGGGTGLDTMTGGPLADQLRGGDGPDIVNGGAGNDNIVGDNPIGDPIGGAGADTIDGGPGNDVINGGGGPSDTVRGGDGNDQVSGGDGDDLEQGGPGDDNMEATQGERAGNDTIDGGEGDDTMQGGNGPNGADHMVGGPGVDKAVYSERTAPLVLSLDNQSNDGEAGEADDVQMDVENVDGGQGGDSIVGSPGANALNGGGGNDSLDGAAGADNLIGGDGVDVATFASRSHAVTVKLDGRANDGESGEEDDVDTENAVGGAGGDDLQGSGGDNSLSGGGGNDDERGGGGNDSLDGGAAEDYMDGGSGADSLVGGDSGDVFRSRDGVADTLTCSGNDFVVADAYDTTSGCERVDLDTSTHKPVLAGSAVVRPDGNDLPDMSPAGIKRLVPLLDTINLPFGSNLDARSGDVRITTSAGSGKAKSSATVLGKTASATISDALFQIKQVKAKVATTDLILKGGSFVSCGGSSSRAAGRGATTAASKKTIRRLFGKGKGRFRTRGRFSAATVRGTTWGVRDRCDGTLTTVRKGRVSVFDFGRKKTITVRTGHTYLARATRAALKKK